MIKLYKGVDMPSAEHDAIAEKITLANPIVGETLEDQRASYDQFVTAQYDLSEISVIEKEIGECKVDCVTGYSASPKRIILYAHGGGYMIGSKSSYRGFAGRLSASTESDVYVVEYGLAPESPYPAAVDQLVDIFIILRAANDRSTPILIAGDSAGGGLALAVVAALKDRKQELPDGIICFSPWVDLTEKREDCRDDPLVSAEGLDYMAETYAGSRKEEPYASPINADMVGFPPLMVFCGTREILLQDSRNLFEQANSFGVDVLYHEEPGLIHIWPVLVPESPEGKAVLKKCGNFVTKLSK